jgi:hypothetical protein
VPGPSDSWYHEKESAWLHRAVAAAEPDAASQALFLKLAMVAEQQADSWRRTHPQIVADFTPGLRARVAARLVKRIKPRHLRPVLAAMKLRGLSMYAGPRAPATHDLPSAADQVGGRVGNFVGASLA